MEWTNVGKYWQTGWVVGQGKAANSIISMSINGWVIPLNDEIFKNNPILSEYRLREKSKEQNENARVERKYYKNKDDKKENSKF